MRYLNTYKLFESDNQDIKDVLNDLSIEILDQGFYTNINEYSQFIIFQIIPKKNIQRFNDEKVEYQEITDELIDSIKRVIEYMYSISWDLGSDQWYSGNKGKLRILRYGGVHQIEPDELSEFIGVDFDTIELAFKFII